MSERAHAVLSPSFLHIALLCAGSVGLKESLPPEPPGLPAIKGTAIHDAGAHVLNDWLEHKISGTDPDRHLKTLTDVETKKVALLWRDIVWEKAFEKSITGKSYGIEEKLILSEKFSLWGTADLWCISTDERAKPYGMVCDLKSGFVFVNADKNPQLAAYACALRKEVRERSSGKKDIDYVRAAIFQPFGDGDKYRETKFTGKQLDAWEKRFYQLAEKVYSGKAKFKSGEHCQYCPGRVKCKEYDKYRIKQTGLKLLDAEDYQFPAIEDTPVEILVNIVRHEKHFAALVKACRKTLMGKLMQGENGFGMKLVEARTRRKWNESTLPNLESELSQHAIELYEQVPRGLTDIKDHLAEKIGKKKSDELLKSFTISPPGGITMADESDSREAVKPTHGLFLEE